MDPVKHVPMQGSFTTVEYGPPGLFPSGKWTGPPVPNTPPPPNTIVYDMETAGCKALGVCGGGMLHANNIIYSTT